MSANPISEWQSLCHELPVLHERLFLCGLLLTAQAMLPAVRSIGFETAKKIEAEMKKAALIQESRDRLAAEPKPVAEEPTK